MSDFITVGKVSEVPEGEARSFEVGDRQVAVVNLDGTWYAFDDICTHRQCSLAEGELEGTSIVCPCHGSEFDITTGEVLEGPAGDAVETFEVRIEGDEIQVAI